MSNFEDIEILEHSLFTIKQISSLLSTLEQYFDDSDLKKGSLTKRQAEVLLFLHQRPAPPSLRQLSRELSTSHQNTKQICNLLEKSNLIRFIEDIQDKRKTLIKLTIKGESKALKINQSLKKISTKIADSLNSNDIDELARILRKLHFLLDDENMAIRKTFKN